MAIFPMPCYITYDDDVLLCLLKGGDQDAFTTTYHRYWETLYKVAFSVLPEETQCLDILHDVFVWLWYHREGMQVTALGQYLYTTVKFKMLNIIRRGKIRPSAIGQYNYIAATTCSEEVTLEVKKLQDMINAFIKDPPEQAM